MADLSLMLVLVGVACFVTAGDILTDVPGVQCLRGVPGI